MKIELVNIKNLKEFAKNIYDNLAGRNILLLRGDLGAGKTTFVRNFCEILDIENQVSSPSFLILPSAIPGNPSWLRMVLTAQLCKLEIDFEHFEN